MKIYSKHPKDCQESEIDAFYSLVAEGGEVITNGLHARIKEAESLVFVRIEGAIVGIGAIKKPSSNYFSSVFNKAEVPFKVPDFTFELGWIYVTPSARGKGLGNKIMIQLTETLGNRICFATTRAANQAMESLFKTYSFNQLGKKYKSINGDYFLVLYGCSYDHCG